ncbi:peptidoglycan DD-metalloendopeptidase family protein [Streptomyces sp. LHD-70]|uniref:peptidoglycan DD-metalloendopeptidase family protein n=1 Tax=Streptomyces sp. LHD-70 TaxID=3072140 RepID=UPI00280F0338|nr:peptidoglycan DD-metalloendopeptidase family protein [Streptomyces sp. LHD-70]MDQ8704283.1 peptidoglycan DD-metalloendopeptidase family protein [Streptomyces sp. LHD-70]
MNDQHGYAAGYDGYTTGAFDTTSFDADPLFGAMPGETGAYDAGQSGQWDNGQWAPGGQAVYDPYANTPQDAGSYASGSYDTTAMWATGGYQPLADIPAQPGPQTAEQWDATGQWQTPNLGQPTEQPTGMEHGQSFLETGAYDATAWNVDGAVPSAPSAPATSADGYDAYGTFDAGSTGFETQAAPVFDPLAFETHGLDPQSLEGQHLEPQAFDTQAFAGQGFETQAFEPHAFDTQAFEPQSFEAQTFDTSMFEHVEHVAHIEQPVPGEHGAAEQHGAEGEFSPIEFSRPAEPGDGVSLPGQVDAADAADAADAPFAAPIAPGTPVGPTPRSRSRRRAPAKRSALLTVAVPSVCALGVAGVAAASVAGGMSDEQADTQTQAAPDPSTVKPSTANSKLDTQLANLSADADDFADRASRTQERIDLKERQEAERKRKAAEAARKEAMRPKFALPVKQHGLSAFYGQSGINWMSTHSGIDFPVSYGTPVLAAADGTVRTQWNPAYGNMAIVTTADGTELWYCHLSSTKIRSGSVKAGDTIAYSGNSGNSTGPHLHFEVRPGGGSAIDPLPWLRSHGLDPT